MVDFNFCINRQGIRGRKGDKGADGFTPTISESVNTADEYKLQITNQFNEFETPNLRGNINVLDNGGSYLKYDSETKQISADTIDAATVDAIGGVVLSTNEKFAIGDETSVLTPALLRDNLTSMIEVTDGLSKTTGETGIISISGKELFDKVTEIKSQADEALLQAQHANNTIGAFENQIDANTSDIGTIRLRLLPKKQDTLIAGENITLTPQSDGTVEISSTGGSAELNPATSTTLGGIKVGSNLSIQTDGTLSADVSSSRIEELGNELNDTSNRVTTAESNIATLTSQVTNLEGEIPTVATTANAGLVKPDGSTITVDEDGTIHASGGGSTPENVMTTDTDQKVTGIKTFEKGIRFVNSDANNYLGLTIDGNGNYMSLAKVYSASINGEVKVGQETYGAYYSLYGTFIETGVNEDKDVALYYSPVLGIGAINARSRIYGGYVLRLYPSITSNSCLRISEDSLTFRKDDGTTVDLLNSSNGGAAPANMVTTDTKQNISGEKTFTSTSTTLCKGSLQGFEFIQSRAGANRTSLIKGDDNSVNHFDALWAFNVDPRFSNGVLSGETSTDVNYERYLRKGLLEAGDNVTIENSTTIDGGVKLSVNCLNESNFIQFCQDNAAAIKAALGL